ncbi:MAG: chromate transporter [Saccharofermentanales bacterium]|jgi:chromate transporter
MMLLKLFLAFLEVGAFAFGGGYAALPLIERACVTRNGWLTIQEMTDVVAISQVTPGPIALNAATFVGTRLAGFAGAIVATTATILPQFIILMILSHFLFKGKPLTLMDRALEALRPGVAGLIGVAALSMFTGAILTSTAPLTVDFVALAAFIVVFLLRLKRINILILIPIGAGIGLLGGLIEHLSTLP